jgi:serine/threonine protein kinase/TolB-like protein
VAGQTVGPYKIAGVLATGGMGEVYLADDARLGRKIALKLLPPQFTMSADRVRRFQQEARATSALNHPNIVTIHDIGQTDSFHFSATEFIDGETLREHISNLRMTIREVLDVAAQVASALQAAHEAGVVHRDVKPENIMLRRDGFVKVLDFGLAKLALHPVAAVATEAPARTMVKTNPGVVMGTVGYMSPEQARGLETDARTDIWSLGVVLYEMVAGQQPFDGQTPTDVIISIAEREPVPLARYAPEVPVQLERIVKKALAKDRERRYQTAKDLLIDLKSLIHDLEVGSEVERSKQRMEPEPARLRRPSPETLVIPEATTRAFNGNPAARALRLSLLFLVPLALAALVYALFIRGHGPTPQPAVSSIVVLPLENLSGDPAQEYFADGMTDALIGDLAKIAELRVISRTSSMHYKGTKKSLPEIASELKVDAVVEGTVQRAGERVLVRAQLIHATTDRHLWAQTYERDLRDVLNLQSDIAQAIARQVQIKLTPAEQARLTPRQPVHPKALDAYLQGRYLFWNKRTEENLRKAIEYFQSAIREDPTYALAYAGLADCYQALGSVQFGALPPMEARSRAEEAAVKALELDPGLAEAHTASCREVLLSRL